MSEIIPPINSALNALLMGFVDGSDGIKQERANKAYADFVDVLSSEVSFKEKLDLLKLKLADYPEFGTLFNYLFDLLMLSFIASDSAKLDPDYLDSDEWLVIEEETSDLGSELLNLYIYLAESEEQEIEPELHDYLNEFLLTDDELYQDDFLIYEELLSNEDLLEAEIEELVEAAEKLETEELKEIMVPMLAFFRKERPIEELRDEIAACAFQKPIHLALFGAICAFAEGLSID
jgi:hypothetical protein